MKISHFLTTVTIVLSAAILAGCVSVGPNYEPIEPKTPTVWDHAVAKELADASGALHSWWSVFEDPMLETLVKDARLNNHSLKIAYARISESRAQRSVVKADWFPHFDGRGSALANRLSRTANPTLPPGAERDVDFFDLGFSMGWEIDLWGRVRRSVQSSEALLEARQEQFRDTLVILYTEVVLSYTRLRTFQRRLQHANDNLTAQEESLTISKARFDAGLVPQLDVHQAELNRARTASVIPLLDQGIQEEIHRMGILTGVLPTELYDVLAPVQPIPDTSNKIPIGLPVDLLRQRPDIRQAERELAAQTAQIGVAAAALYPNFELQGALTTEGVDNSDLFESDSDAYSIGPVLRWNLFDGKRVRGLIDVEEARTEQALHNYEETVLFAFEEVENALVAITQERRRNTALVSAADAAEKSVDQVKTLYKNGLTDFQNVLDAERSLLVQQDELATSDGVLVGNLILLYKALGGGWQPEAEDNP